MERYFPEDRLVLTGNPIRKDLLEHLPPKEEAANHFMLNPNRPVLVVLGGSLGARRVNELIEKELTLFAEQGVQLLWQCGKLYASDYLKHNSDHVKVLPFIERMDLAYAAADVIISRAGAGSVSELALVEKPLLLIPSPNVAEDHQTKNARSLVEIGGARMLKENELEEQFESEIRELLENQDLQNQLKEGLREYARPLATEKIVDEIIKLLPKV